MSGVSVCVFLLIRHNREVRLLPLVQLVGLVRLVATRVNADFLVTCHSIDDEQVRGDLKRRWAQKMNNDAIFDGRRFQDAKRGSGYHESFLTTAGPRSGLHELPPSHPESRLTKNNSKTNRHSGLIGSGSNRYLSQSTRYERNSGAGGQQRTSAQLIRKPTGIWGKMHLRTRWYCIMWSHVLSHRILLQN